MKFSGLTMPEIEYIRQQANFTEDEEKAFLYLTKGKTILEISFQLCVSERTVNRIVKRIKGKIAKVGDYIG